MERFVHNLELFYSGIRLSVIGLDKRLDVSSFVGSHLTTLARHGGGGGGGGGVLASA